MDVRLFQKLKETPEQRYRGDVIYDVWQLGGNPDAVDYDDVGDDFRDGLYAEESAAREMRRQHRRS